MSVNRTPESPVTPSRPLKRTSEIAELSTPYRFSTLTQHSGYVSGNLTHGRIDLLEDLQHIPYISVKEFLGAFLPPVESLEEIVAKLKNRQAITEMGWRVFATEPSKDPRNEATVFKAMERIFDAVASANELPVQSIIMRSMPNHSPMSERNRSGSRPDAFIQVCETTSGRDQPRDDGKPFWDDIVLSSEWKKGDEATDKRDVNTSPERSQC